MGGSWVFAAVAGLHLALFWAAFLTYSFTYITKRSCLYINARGPDVLLTDLIVITNMASAIAVREIMSVSPVGLPCFWTRLAFTGTWSPFHTGPDSTTSHPSSRIQEHLVAPVLRSGCHEALLRLTTDLLCWDQLPPKRQPFSVIEPPFSHGYHSALLLAPALRLTAGQVRRPVQDHATATQLVRLWFGK